MVENGRGLLRLLHVADSALPIGATAHSFGLETLAQDDDLTPAALGAFCEAYLQEVGGLEAAFCREGHRLAARYVVDAPSAFCASWRALNDQLAALRPARESRAASHALGTRFLRLLHDLEPHPALVAALGGVQMYAGDEAPDTHYCCAFGLGGMLLGLDETTTAIAFLRQNVAGIISACQRLMPLGQARAGQILWRLHDSIEAVAAGCSIPDDGKNGCLPFAFSPLVDVGSMRHPNLPVRLFVS